MRSNTHSKRGAVLALTVVAAAVAAGCSHKTAEVTAPQQIKAAMGGNYSPSVQAQAQAFAQQQAQRRQEMTLTRGKGYSGTAGGAVGGNP